MPYKSRGFVLLAANYLDMSIRSTAETARRVGKAGGCLVKTLGDVSNVRGDVSSQTLEIQQCQYSSTSTELPGFRPLQHSRIS